MQMADKVRKIPFLNSRLKPLARAITNSTTNTDIGEITPLVPRCSGLKKIRINLLVPSISREHLFGGISTALTFFHTLADYKGLDRRIILTDAGPDASARERFPDYRFVDAGKESRSGNEVVPFNDRYQKTLAVGEHDYFMATSWWTAYHARDLMEWQCRKYQLSPRKLIYFIQDFEPGFYPWSARYALADSTYRGDCPQIAVFNSSLLQAYFKNHHYHFQDEFTFEPVLNEKLKTGLGPWRKERKPKKKQILIYGRPGVERNAFSLILAGLKKWVWQQTDVHQWQLLSVGEQHPDIDLGNNMILKSAGKLSLDDYSTALAASALGVSFMVSPHPSYPPMEMAVFGMGVISNRFENKDLSTWHSNITAIDLSVDAMVDALLNNCNRFCRDGETFIKGNLLKPEYLLRENPFPFVPEVLTALFS